MPYASNFLSTDEDNIFGSGGYNFCRLPTMGSQNFV